MKQTLFYSITIFIFVISFISGHFFWTSIGLSFTFYIFIRLLDKMGNTIPIIELMTAMAALQWIFGPFLEYGREFEHYRYRMYTSEVEYMRYVVPAVLMFWFGANNVEASTTLEDLKAKINRLLEDHPTFPYVLIIAGAGLPFLSVFFPPSLHFVFFLLASLKYIGVIYLLHSSHQLKWLIFAGVLLLTTLSSVGAGMFHDLILWSLLLFTFLAKEWKLRLPVKILIAVIGIFAVMTIQAVKTDLRSQVWGENYEGNRISLFFRLASEQWKTGSIITPNDESHMFTRLNQGWIISAIMYTVPENVDHANGETIKDGIVASLLPRIIAPNKPTAGGRKNFRKYTGLYISDSTSMGISIAGEAYVNFKKMGGIAFMAFWGVFINIFWIGLERLSKYFPTLLVWSPMLFLQVVKAETEFGVVLNHLIKSGVLVFALIYIIRRMWGITTQNEFDTEGVTKSDNIE